VIRVSLSTSTFNRAPLLDRALQTLSRQTLASREWEYVLVDDGSTDNTKEVCDKWRDLGVPVRYVHAQRDLDLHKNPGEWRDGCVPRNAGSTMCRGEVFVSSHPEIMIPPDGLECLYRTATTFRDSWVTAVPYWMPPDEKVYDEQPWREDLFSLRNAEGFYAGNWPEPIEGIDYRNAYQERRVGNWNSEVLWAMTTRLWRIFGGFQPSTKWGSVDVSTMERRRAAKIPTRIARSRRSPAPSGSLMCFHQFHDSPRSAEGWQDELRELKASYATPEDACRAGGLYNLFWTGQRERDNAGYTVLGDHVARYKFASQFAKDETVLDLCMGTGYGSQYLAPTAYRYVGIDSDGESVQWANEQHAVRANVEFWSDLAWETGLADNSVDVVCFFEAIEHLNPDEQRKTLAEIDRVLKPDGVLVMSTPVKGVAPGTVFDRHMVTPDELDALLTPHFPNRVRHHQGNYGPAEMNPVKDGFDPTALIQIVVARKS
jgi:SAM-dependent methyltransferase